MYRHTSGSHVTNRGANSQAPLCSVSPNDSHQQQKQKMNKQCLGPTLHIDDRQEQVTA